MVERRVSGMDEDEGHATIRERKALKELLDPALSRSDAGSIVPRPLPSETMFMLMLVHLKVKVNELESDTNRETSPPP